MTEYLHSDPFVREASRYDTWFDQNPELFSAQIELIRPFLVSESCMILDIGCGPGRFAAALTIRYGIDRSLPFCRMAYHRGVAVIRGDVSALPVRSRIMHQVLLITVLGFIKEQVVLLGEIRRILVPGGSLVLAEIDMESDSGKKYLLNHSSSTFLSQGRLFSLPVLVSLIGECSLSVHSVTQSAGLVVVTARSPDHNTSGGADIE